MQLAIYDQCNREAVERLAKHLAERSEIGDCYMLSGDLGAGKSTFARAFIRSLCGQDTAVASPTFTLAQSYEIHTGAHAGELIWHYDLYRLESSAELEEIGLMETLDDAVNLVEWPEIAKTQLEKHAMHIIFAFHDQPDYRSITIAGENSWMPHLPQTLL